MLVPLVSLEDATQMIGVLPMLAPCPTASNIQALIVNLVKKLTTIRSMQLSGFGFSGRVEQAYLYALNTNVPWAN